MANLYSEFSHPSGIPTIDITDASGTAILSVPFQGPLPEGDPRRSLQILGWSPDSRILYFYYAFSFDGALTLWNGYDLQSVDVPGGEVHAIVTSDRLVAFAFSPDSTLLAFVREEGEPRRLAVRDLQTGEERAIEVSLPTDPYTQIGWLSWSPMGTGFLFWTWEAEWLNIYYLDANTMGAVHLQGYFFDEYIFENWIDDTRIRLQSTLAGTVIDIDVLTGDVVNVATPTPNE